MELTKSTAQQLLQYLDRTLLLDKVQRWLTTASGSNSRRSVAVIGQALAVAGVGIFLYKLLVPPANLRHVPQINVLRMAYSFLSMEQPGTRTNRLVLPTVLRNKSKGYVVNIYWHLHLLCVDFFSQTAICI